MAVKETIEGYSVIVFVPVGERRTFNSFLSSMTAEQAFAEAQNIRDSIKRHVAPYCEFERHIDIEPQINRICEHCGYGWTEKSNDYNGGCCTADEEAHVAALASPTVTED